MPRHLFAMIAAALALPAHAAPAPSAPTAIDRALADPARADQAQDDARRQARAVLLFSGVKRGDRVIDYLPGSGYWTRIFTDIVGPSGHVYALWPKSGAKYAEKALPALQARHLANVTAAVLPSNILAVREPVDLVWTVQNYHDLANDGAGVQAITAFNASAFKMLKPGGTYVVIDHAAPAGSGLADTGTLHRIDPAIVRKEVEAAGFRFVGRSNVLANPADDHTKKVFDPAIRGHTDQFVFKFRKPRSALSN